MPAPASSGDPEVVLSQALRAMVGGPKPGPAPAAPAHPGPRLSLLQLLLLAALIGLVLGVVVGLLSLVL